MRMFALAMCAVVYLGGAAQAQVATYYGQELAGKRTASGETFNPSAMTAAHRTLPFGTRVRVTNSQNGRSIVVRINDRGPFVKGPWVRGGVKGRPRQAPAAEIPEPPVDSNDVAVTRTSERNFGTIGDRGDLAHLRRRYSPRATVIRDRHDLTDATENGHRARIGLATGAC
jgi:Lytic transglycolase